MTFFSKMGKALDGFTEKAGAKSAELRQKAANGIASAKDLISDIKGDPTVVTATYNGRELAISNPEKVSIEFNGGAMAVADENQNAVIIDSNGGIQTNGSVKQNADVYDLGNDGTTNLIILQK